MTKTCFAALLVLCGLTAAAPAQVYTSYYTPYTTYYHAPAYTNYSYTTGYGPLGVLNPMTWFGWRPRAYTSPYYGSAYTAAYAPAVSYTAAYSPAVTSYYAPAADTTIAYYTTPVSTASACCDPCCNPCCATCPTGGCPGGNCAMNYSPADLSPRPDPASSGSSGTRTYESESNGTSPSGGTDGDRFRRSTDPEADGFGAGPGASRDTYRLPMQIEQRAPTDLPQGERTGPDPAGDENIEEPEADDPAASAPLLNLDAKVTAAPSLLRERLPMRARFGSPTLARAKVDPATLPAGEDVRLVRK